ncbi:hypothetical protein TOT_020000792 [Theileria orientalis strain Shintoku]|uniref:Uncharacterized protein n=1 Tax=Theileria orientalis strain Shintoku TaxID=869250 RepID=J4CD52_THEOR|nr:hypothetical protein TOT_020000792 [Theileria orientalis strain Shintoku]BAM40537.1 hypothetical protein TOT_020000792 [Theileria orientalis strain Shintoku]|eukprot:XP_009690838.1 hypothetical protein TOT_020000792 [Theileria orientalis strain Shintoku]
MDNFNEDCIKYLGYPFSFDFIVKLHKYFDLYYRNLFCKIAPIWLKFIHNEYNTLVEKLNSNSYDKLKLNDKLNILICPCLLGVYRSDSYRSFLIFPFYCKINSNLKVSNDMIELFKRISSNLKLKDSSFNCMNPNEIKLGSLDSLQRIISKSQDIKILISVYFNTNTDFTLFELDFNNSLNYLNST